MTKKSSNRWAAASLLFASLFLLAPLYGDESVAPGLTGNREVFYLTITMSCELWILVVHKLVSRKRSAYKENVMKTMNKQLRIIAILTPLVFFIIVLLNHYQPETFIRLREQAEASAIFWGFITALMLAIGITIPLDNRYFKKVFPWNSDQYYQ